MTKKILELTEKIYHEGIEKVKGEGEMIIRKAKKEAEKILTSAKNKEKEILDQALKHIDELKKNTDSELRLTSQQFINVLKQKITKLIIAKQTESPIKNAFEDEDFIKQTILTIVKNWNPQNNKEVNLKLILPSQQENTLQNFFKNEGEKLLSSGVEINFDSNIKSGFKIEPKDGGYYINFTDKAFENYFKDYLKPKTKKMLFE